MPPVRCSPSAAIAEVLARSLGPPPGRRGGRGAWWRCPFHPDRNPSLTVKGGRWHCFGCGAGGDAPAFVMRHAGLTFPEALAELGLARRPDRKARRLPAVPKCRQEGGEPSEAWKHAAARIAAGCEEALWGPEGREALAYLVERRFLAPETIRAANLGFNPRWRRLPELAPPGASRPPSLAPGIVIPWMGADGGGVELINVRRLDGGEPKYRALPGSRRGGIYPGPRAVRPGAAVIACEGEFDCLLLAQALGASASVVTLGSASAVPSVGSRVALLPATRRYAATDADAAGDEAALRWLGPHARRILPPGGCKDWTEAFAAGHDPGASWRRVLAGGEPSLAGEAREDPTLPHRITLPADHGLRARILALSERGREAWDERAAIAEYDGNLPRGEAERLAYASILRGRGP